MQLFFCLWGVSLTNKGVFPDEVQDNPYYMKLGYCCLNIKFFFAVPSL